MVLNTFVIEQHGNAWLYVRICGRMRRASMQLADKLVNVGCQQTPFVM